jgi:hypothetical protein
MDFTFLLDGAVWASRARRTLLAVGEPGSEPRPSVCTDGMVESSVASVTGWSMRRSLARGGDLTLAFCYQTASLVLTIRLIVRFRFLQRVGAFSSAFVLQGQLEVVSYQILVTM